MTARFALSIAFILALSGCLEETVLPEFHAVGTDGWFALGYAYDGVGVIAFDGSINITADEEANAGLAFVTGRLNNEEWRITFDQFKQAAGKEFQNGGIAHNLREHGASGVADTSIPEVQVRMAAWGEANITVDGTALPDPVTGDARWLAHYMVITTGVRDDRTHAIYARDQQTPYDPANASDGHAGTDYEIHLVLRSHGTPDANVSTLNVAQGGINDAQYSESHDLFENKYVGSRANLTFTSQANVVGRSQFRFEVLDPDGDPVLTYNTAGGPQQETSDPSDFVMEKVGQYKVAVTGTGVNAEYAIDGSVVPPAAIVMNFWWEQASLDGQPAAT